MVVKTITPPAAPLRIVLGGDEAGFAYKAAIFQDLEDDPRVSVVTDVGPYSVSDTTAYPHYAVAAARKIASGEADRAILICGTGLGVAIAANKVPGIHAVPVPRQLQCRTRRALQQRAGPVSGAAASSASSSRDD
ncbi:ribose 5-phosphate isomerase [Pseudogymnoascus sp. 24MN13]|nr:ribose 5-phosphate isomerase [Pseudogymnoascus sp. 24MN13]